MPGFLVPELTSKARTHKAADIDLLAVDVPGTDNIMTAQFALVGEAPSSVEMAEGVPFAGPAGNQLDRICSVVQLPRFKLYITNFCKTMLPKNNTDVLWTAKGYRCPQWGTLQKNLIDELSAFPGKLIILMGETAMRGLLDEPRFDNIGNFRGSIYPAEHFKHLAEPLAGKYIAITHHPASSLGYADPLKFYIIMNDLQKFMTFDNDPGLLDPYINITTNPTLSQILEFYAYAKTQTIAAYDIESTPRHITCFSLACYGPNPDDPIQAISIPLMNNRGNMWHPEDEIQIWDGLADILGDPNIRMVCQNGMFDIMFTLRTMGIKTDNFFFDTMLAQHICWTDLPKSLDFLVSVYTYHPYYSDGGKQKHLKLIKDWPSYWLYNAKDSAYALELVNPLQEELETFGAKDAMDYTMALHKPLMEMEWTGIRTDLDGIKEEKKRLQRKVAALQHGINKLVGKPLNTNSSQQMIAYFYGTCQIRPYINRKTGNATCDAVAMSRIAKKGGIPGAIARMTLSMRTASKLISTYFEVSLDPDSRLRCTHKISGTVSGRIATEKTFFGTGTSLQNQPPAFKKFLIADPDQLMFEVDLAKAEAHVVAYLSQDANMMEAFIQKIDVHTYNASKIFDVPFDQVTKHQRKMGKRVVHASNYGMGPQTFSDDLAKDNIFMSVRECRQLLDAYTRRFPGLKRWHREIESEIYESRILYNLFSRPKRFLGRIDAALFRNAYSYKPQSTVAELLNRGSIKMVNDPELRPVTFLSTVHDSNLGQFSKTHSLDTISFFFNRIQEHLTHEFTYRGRSFTIGCDFKIGLAWADNVVELKNITPDHIGDKLDELYKLQ